ncbi:MAG: uracil-DNA glycosylase [Nitrososphaerota archaeon]|nr:uracil-DNA glycosylase [Nitrososphaerota archaeon]
MKTDTLEALAVEVRNCHLCPLAKGRTNAVPGEGSGRSKIVLVGEAPGREEDLSGRPFVGRGGRILRSALDSVGVASEQAYISNVVKCRPPKNRLPTRNEIDICRGAYLSRELELVDPDFVVLLGRTASRTLLGVDSLGSVRGKVVKMQGRRYLSAYHPAAVLRNPGLKGAFWHDLRKIRNARTASNRI